MAERRVGIDIGATAVRVVETRGMNKDSFALVTAAASEPLPPGSVVSGRILDPAAVAWSLRQAIRSARVSGYGAVLGLAAPETAIATVVMPAALDPSQWTTVLRTGETSISPKTPVGASALSLYPVGQEYTRHEEQVRQLLAGTALKSHVDLIREVCRKAKVTPRAVDLAGAAAMRCMTRTVEGNDDVATLVDIGASKTTIATRHGLHLRSLVTIDAGGDDITKAVQGATGSTFQEAEQLKLSMRLMAQEFARAKQAAQVAKRYGELQETRVNEDDETNVAQEAMTAAADHLIDQIATAIENDNHRHPDHPSQGIALCGGASLMRGLKERIVARIGLPASIGRPWAEVVKSKRTEHLLSDGAEDPVEFLALATAVGLAMWKDPS
jgi:type IV pilus assembly protein PilM